MHLSAAAVAVAASLFMSALADDQCYYPDGTTSTDVPCNSSATNSACCASSAYCLSNGACMSSGILSRGSCTDQNWDADECCPYCQNCESGEQPSQRTASLTDGLDNTGGGYALMACTNVTFTCGFDPDKCSVSSSVFNMKDAESIMLKSDQLTSAMEEAGVSSETSSSESDSHSAISATSVSIVTVTATGSAVSDDAKEYTAGQMAGVGVGVGVPLLLAVGALSWLLVRERKRTNANEPDFHPLQSPEATDQAHNWAAWSHPMYGQQQRMPTELSNEQVLEIDTPHRPAELEPKHR